MAEEKRIKHNKIRCKLCDDVIESKHHYDFVRCKCENAFVDGGKDYVRFGAKDLSTVECLTEYYEEGEDN